MGIVLTLLTGYYVGLHSFRQTITNPLTLVHPIGDDSREK